ncbi:hypothetical protein HDU96_009471 [Phlyctochytrium bullatum]|nr:hypothetical protein HDU96_009471 [Phlyctochytrium bullatum]
MPARFSLQPLPAYAHAYLYKVPRSLASSFDAHLDNAGLVTILSDCQQRFYDRLHTRTIDIEQRAPTLSALVPKPALELLRGIPLVETINADLQVRYIAMAHKYDELRVEVGVDPASLSRVSFTLRFRVTLHRRAVELQQEENLTPIVDLDTLVEERGAQEAEGNQKLVALAEIGVVRLNMGRPCELGGLKQALEEVIADQDRLLAKLEKNASELGMPGGDVAKGLGKHEQRDQSSKPTPSRARL